MCNFYMVHIYDPPFFSSLPLESLYCLSFHTLAHNKYWVNAPRVQDIPVAANATGVQGNQCKPKNNGYRTKANQNPQHSWHIARCSYFLPLNFFSHQFLNSFGSSLYSHPELIANTHSVYIIKDSITMPLQQVILQRRIYHSQFRRFQNPRNNHLFLHMLYHKHLFAHKP